MTPPDGSRVPLWARRALSYVTLYTLCQLLVLNFLAYDLLRRLSGGLEPPNVLSLLANIAVVGSFGCAVSAVLAGVLWSLDRAVAGLSQPLLVLLLCNVNFAFAKYRVAEWFESHPLSQRSVICGLALLLTIPLGLAARDSLAALRDAVARAGTRLALALTLPFLLGATLSAGAGLFFRPAAEAPAQPRSGSPDVLLLTIDTLAARDMSLYGYSRPTTPELERFAKSSVVFQNAHSASNTSNTSLPTYEGFYYHARVEEDTLLARLRRAGYKDNLFVSFNIPEFFGLQRPENVRAVPAFEGSPLYQRLARVWAEPDLGWLAWLVSEDWCYFVAYDPRVGVEYHQYWNDEHFSEEKCLAVAEAHLLKPRSSPTFVWVHLWQPHYPYFPRAPFKGRFDSAPLPYPPMNNAVYTPGYQDEVDVLRRSYDEYVLDVDSAVGRFLQSLEAGGALSNTIVVIGADHGESFEDGWVGHGGPWLTESLIHIPLMLRWPGGKQAGLKPESFVSPLDLAPTILAYLGLEVPRTLMGESLQPYILDPKKRSVAPKLSVSYWAYTRGKGQVAVFSDRFKVLFSRENESDVRVYDLVADPGQTTDVRERFGDRVEAVVRSVKWPES